MMINDNISKEKITARPQVYRKNIWLRGPTEGIP